MALLAIGHLLTTAKAVPHMVGVREDDDGASLREALEGFPAPTYRTSGVAGALLGLVLAGALGLYARVLTWKLQ